MNNRPKYLAVDAGGTKCLAILIDPVTGVVRQGHGGASNPDNVGLKRAQAEIRRAVVEAAGDQGRVARLAVGLAGLDTPQAKVEAQAWVREALAETGLELGEVLVENDAEMSLRGAAQGGPGLLIVAGTGSIAVATDGHRTARAGGWGYWVGDVGSGLHVARLALAAAYAAHDQGLPPGPLAEALAKQAGVTDLFELQGWLYGAEQTVEGVAALSRAVDQAAAAGDPLALEVLQEGGRRLAEEAVTAARRLDLQGAFPIFLVGGVVTHCRTLRAALLGHLQRHFPEARVEEPKTQPVLGAALVALGTASAELTARLSQQLSL